ncbi:MAG TPA: hypothetical protein VFE71_04440 [Bacteroidales bacterium]|nr:hypothetical protein [Bacteroidales bacterium]
MITEQDLLNLKYKVLTRLDDIDKTVEFIHEDLGNRGYMVKLRKGEVQTLMPPDMKKSGWKTSNIQELIEWHFLYLKIYQLL